MNKGISVGLLIIGIVLLVFAYGSYHSASSDVSQAVTGSPTSKAIWLLIGGLIAAVWGGTGLARR